MLGIEILSGVFSPGKHKIKAIKHALPPSNIGELGSFIGVCTYVLKFFEIYIEKAAVLCQFLFICFNIYDVDLCYFITI